MTPAVIAVLLVHLTATARTRRASAPVGWPRTLGADDRAARQLIGLIAGMRLPRAPARSRLLRCRPPSQRSGHDTLRA
jgi:hypothetical protein